MELISVLVLTYFAGGSLIESEIRMPHAACMAADATLSIALTGPEKSRPIVELINGKRTPVTSVRCVPACFSEDDAELQLLRDAEVI